MTKTYFYTIYKKAKRSNLYFNYKTFLSHLAVYIIDQLTIRKPSKNND